jgi:hypothetical protein
LLLLLSFWTPQQGQVSEVVYPAGPDFDFDRLMREHSTTLTMPAEGFVLKPGAFILGWTREQIQ